MLWTIVIILIVLWALGLFTHVAGGLIHLLLVVAIIVIVVNLVRGRRILWQIELRASTQSRARVLLAGFKFKRWVPWRRRPWTIGSGTCWT